MLDARLAAVILVASTLAGCAGDGGGEPTGRPTATLETNHGTITLELYGDLTPQTVKNFGSLAQEGYYDQVKVHRVIADFMIQGGDPNTKQPESRDNRWGTGGPGYTIVDEFPCQDGTLSTEWTDYGASQGPCAGHGGLAVAHDSAGMLSMANKGSPKSGGSQFFITLAPQPRLDGTHTVFGEVVDGMSVVQEIGQVETNDRDQPVEPVVIESVTIDGALPDVEVDEY